MVKIKLVAPYEIPGVSKADLTEALKYLKKQSVIGFDIETMKLPIEGASALDPHTNKVVTIQLGTDRIVYVFDMRYTSINKLKSILETKKIKKVGANLKFDVKNMIKFNVYCNNLHDVMLWEQIMHNGWKKPKGYYSLSEISKRWNIFDYDNNDIGISKDIRLAFTDVGPLTYHQVLYAGFDVFTAVKIYKKQFKYSKDLLIQKCIDLENEFVVALAWAEYCGMNLNPMKWLSNLDIYKQQLKIQTDKLKNFAEEHEMEYINWNSPKQVIPLFKKLGVPVSILDKEKSAETGEEVIKETVGKNHIQKFSSSHPIVEEYLEFKQLKRLTTAYGEKFLENINPVSGRIHSDYFQILHTGRISSSNPNQQNIPSKRPGYRECFDAPEGREYVVADYSSQEMRVLADVANEEVMIDFFINGDGDLHSLTGRRMFGVDPCPKDLRQIAKVLGFTIVYGGSPHKIADVFQVSISTGADWIKKYMSAYPALQPHFDKAWDRTIKDGYITIDDITGRRYYPESMKDYVYTKQLIEAYKAENRSDEIPKNIWSKYYIAKGDIQRKCQNFPIQGTSGSITKTAAILFLKWVIKSKLHKGQVLLANMVHDEIVVECDAALSDVVTQKLGECMEEAGRKFLSKVPLPAQLVKALYWKH